MGTSISPAPCPTATAKSQSPMRWPNPRQRARMTPVNEPEDAEPDDQQTGADLDRPLPFDEGDQQRKRQNHQEHRKQMAERQRPKRRHQGARTSSHQPG